METTKEETIMIPTNFLASTMTSAILGREDQVLSNFLANERSSIKTFKGQVDSFEQKLKQQTQPLGNRDSYGEMRYPLDIGQTKEYTNIMRITTYKTDTSAFETERFKAGFKQSLESISNESSMLGEQVRDRLVGSLDFASEASENFKDYIPDASVTIASPFLGGASTPFLAGAASFGRATTRLITNPDSDSGDYQREFTGLNYGTAKIEGSDIYLYCPPEVRVSYSNQTTSQDFQSLTPYILPLSGKSEQVSSLAKQIGMANVKKFAGIIPGLDESVGNAYVENSLRQVINPMNVARFQGTERRSFNFDFVFYPKSKEEMLSCYKIIKHLKRYSHPSRADDGRFLTYPAEFQIEFLNADDLTQNDFLPKISKCSLTGITVSYGESIVMASFMPSEIGKGSPPTKITVALTFTELEILTSERFTTDGGSVLTH